MATRCRIALKIKNRYKSIYCHSDGYPSHVGTILKNYYKSPAKIKKLLDLGDISSLGPQIGKKHKFNDYNPDYVTAYKRDRGEVNTSARYSDNLNALKSLAQDSYSDYLYVYEKGNWYNVKL